MVSSRGRVRAVAFLFALFAVFIVDPVDVTLAGTIATPSVVAVGRGSEAQTNAWVSREADHLSGRKLTVECAGTAREWALSLVDAGLPPADAGRYYGFSLIGEGEMHLSPYVCEGLRVGAVASSRRKNELQVAWSVNVLVHESVHMARFTFNEALTEACARIGLPAELHRLYRVAYHSAEMRRLIVAATWFRRTMGPAYLGGTCSAPAA